MTKLGTAFRLILEKVDCTAAKQKLTKILSMPCKDVLLYFDVSDQHASQTLLLVENGAVKSVCLACSDWNCQGCKGFNPAAPSKDLLVRRHENYLAHTCRICGVKSDKGSHRCMNGETCDSKICKYSVQDVIKEKYEGLDVRFEDNAIFPCKM